MILLARLAAILREKYIEMGIGGIVMGGIGLASSELAALASRYLLWLSLGSAAILLLGIALVARGRMDRPQKDLVASGLVGCVICGFVYVFPPAPPAAPAAPGTPAATVTIAPAADPREALARRGTPWTVAAFRDAMEQGDLRTVELFLAGGMRPDAPIEGCTALWYAVARGMPQPREQFALFARHGFDVNAALPCRPFASVPDMSGPIIDAAIDHRQAEATEALLALGARVPRDISARLAQRPLVGTDYARQLGPRLERAPKR